jgi:hypothetical protein
LIEILESVIEAFQVIFITYNISKWTNKVLRKSKKKFKNEEERINFLFREVCHCITMVHVLSLIIAQTDIPETSTILWVDDSPENNMEERSKATISHEIDICLARSTEEALQWLDEHQEQFKSADSAHFRIVTDWYRPDEKDEAAASLTGKVRDAGWDAPILIYCSESTNPSSLLAEHSLTSTSSSDHLLAFYWASMKMNSGSTTKKAGKKATAAKKTAKTVVAAAAAPREPVKEKEEEEPSLPPPKLSSNTSNAKKEKEEPSPPKVTTARASNAKKSKSAKIALSNDGDEVEKVDLIPSVVIANETMSKVNTKTKAKHVEEEEIKRDEIPSTMDLSSPGDEPIVKSSEIIESTLPSTIEDPKLEKQPTEVVPAVASRNSNIHDILAARIPKDDDGKDEEFEEIHVKKTPSKAKAKKSSKQLFDDDDDEEEYIVDDGAKMDVDNDHDFNISDADVKNERITKKTKSKDALSRQTTTPMEESLPSAPSTITPKSKQKKDWNSFLVSRIPGSILPASPLSMNDESTDSAIDHLLATPPAKKVTTKAKKSSTVVGVKSPKMSPDPTPISTPQISPVEKPRPPKPTAPIGPAPIRSLSALDDDDDDDDDDEEDSLPLFTKVPSPPMPIASSSNTSDNLIQPSKSILIGLPAMVFAGRVTEALLQGKNKDGMSISIGGASVSVILCTDGNAHEFEGFVDDNKNGTYSISFFPTRTGQYRIMVRVDGEHIHGSPLSIEVIHPMSKKRSSTSAFPLEEDDSMAISGPGSKRLKERESSLPEFQEEDDGDAIEATQVV